jgi:hypothetical protein
MTASARVFTREGAKVFLAGRIDIALTPSAFARD